MKKILSIVLVLLMIMATLTACTTETDSKDTENKETETKETVSLPESVDLRNYNGKNYVTPVKCQMFGDCWSFGIAGAAEISYLYANDMGVPAGEVNDAVDFSEKYINWFVYSTITDDDVIVGKVRASQVGEGFDPSEAEEYKQDSTYFIGGASYSGANLFASGFLPVDESTSINGEQPYAYRGKNSEFFDGELQYSVDDDWTIPVNAEYRNPETNSFFRNGNYLPSPASVDKNGDYKFSEEGLTAIKEEIYNGHGVAIAVLCEGTINYENWAAYNVNGMANHVVTVVGYDDNYPKENFARKYMTGEVNKDSIPPEDGAFILKNSFGEWGYESSGYYYMSYYDHTITHVISFEFDKNDSVKYKNPNYEQYDMLMYGTCGVLDYDSETKTANVFDVEEDASLFAIEYKTYAPDINVHYEIYKNPEDGSPDSGELLESGDKSNDWAGYHKVDLSSEYQLKKGDKYSVILTMTYADKSSCYAEFVSYANSMKIGAKATGIVNKGESYRYTNNKWTDLCELTDKLKEEMYKQNKEIDILDIFKAHSVDDIAVDNYPIKAMLNPENN